MESTETPELFNFDKESKAIKDLISQFDSEKSKVKMRREIRENRKNVLEEREKGTILEDETIIPDRTVNTNIKRSKTNYINFVTQSKRTLIITEMARPKISIDSLETWFTRGMRFPRWKAPWNRLIDSFHVHGGSGMEVMFDDSKPHHVTLEYIPRDSLIFPLKCCDLQACPRILRAYEITTLQLEEFAEKYAFNPDIVTKLQERFKEQHDKTFKVYRVLMKKQGAVYNAWYTQDDNPTSWLREPQLHDLGLFNFDPEVITAPVALIDPMGLPVFDQMGAPVQVPLCFSPMWDQVKVEFSAPLPLNRYPIVWVEMEETENEELLASQGRVALDVHVQEAMTSLWTDTVNATHRASQFYPSAEEEPGNDGQLKELGKMRHGYIMNRKLSVFQPNWPNNIALSVLQGLKMGKTEEAGQQDFASMARKDANKTATEMKLALESSESLKISDLDIFSSAYLEIYSIAFQVACHQALFGLISAPQHPELLIGNYNIQSAGDVEVVKRAEDKENAKEFFNIVQGTPAAEKILIFLIERFFPDQADEWIQALSQPDKDQVILMLVNILKTIPIDELQLSDEHKLALRNVIATASSMVAGPNNAAADIQSSMPQDSGAGEGDAMPQGEPVAINP